MISSGEPTRQTNGTSDAVTSTKLWNEQQTVAQRPILATAHVTHDPDQTSLQ
jgi:hypothetical protein